MGKIYGENIWGKYMGKISKTIADFDTEYMKAEPEEAESHVYEMNLDLTDINASLQVCAQELEFRLGHLNHAVKHVDFDEARKCLKELEFFQSCYSALNEWRLGLQTAMITGSTWQEKSI